MGRPGELVFLALEGAAGMLLVISRETLKRSLDCPVWVD